MVQPPDDIVTKLKEPADLGIHNELGFIVDQLEDLLAVAHVQGVVKRKQLPVEAGPVIHWEVRNLAHPEYVVISDLHNPVEELQEYSFSSNNGGVDLAVGRSHLHALFAHVSCEIEINFEFRKNFKVTIDNSKDVI